jgi:cell wall-associated NlpC family hydrolase
MQRLDPRLNAVRPDLADAALQGQVEATRFVHGEPSRVVAAQAPVRRAPSADSTLLTEALCGERLTVFETNPEGWSWVQLAGDRYVGWLPADALDRSAPEPTHKVAALRTLVFAGADIKTPPLASLPFGAEVSVTGEAEDRNARYALIAPAGAIVKQHLASPGAVENDWVTVAERFMGTPYLWGGKTSLGIDCSGLMQVALAACGIAAPRDSDMQEATLGAALPLEDGFPRLQRGDLVFWKAHAGFMRDDEVLLHANAHHMAVAAEPLRDTIERLERRGLRVTAIRRLHFQRTAPTIRPDGLYK